MTKPNKAIVLNVNAQVATLLIFCGEFNTPPFKMVEKTSNFSQDYNPAIGDELSFELGRGSSPQKIIPINYKVSNKEEHISVLEGINRLFKNTPNNFNLVTKIKLFQLLMDNPQQSGSVETILLKMFLPPFWWNCLLIRPFPL